MIDYKCPKCGEAMSSPDSMAGGKETCPSCGENATVSGKATDVSRTRPIAPAVGRRYLPVWLVATACGVIGLIVGFFVGREYLKWEIRSTIEASFNFADKKMNPSKRRSVGSRTPAAKAVQSEGDKPSKPAAPPRNEQLIKVAFAGKQSSNIGVELSFNLTNRTGKVIQSLKGGVHIYDQFGDHLSGLEIKRDQPIAIGQTVSDGGVWPVGKRTVELLENGRAGLIFKVEHVIYEDGTQEQFE